MALILGIESSCDETAAAVYDSSRRRLLSSSIFSQISLHEKYGGVVPEIASRSHLKKIGIIVDQALDEASVSIEKVDAVAVTSKPGLAGALLIGLSFAKGLAWANKKKIIGIDHLEAHIFSTFFNDDGTVRSDIAFPHLCLLVSGGHTALYLVKNFGKYELIGETLDDAAGEAFDKVAKLLDLGYPGGPPIERFAERANFEDFFSYPRTKKLNKILDFSFSGIKTAVLYDLVNRGAYSLESGLIKEKMSVELAEQVASSFLVCVADVLEAKVRLALKKYREITGVTFSGGVACNSFLRKRLKNLCEDEKRFFVVPHKKFCGDNAAMVALVGGYKYEARMFDDISLDVF